MSPATGEPGAERGESPLGSFIVDARGVVLAFDERMETLARRSAAEVVGRAKDSIGSGPGGARGDGPSVLYDGAIEIPEEGAPAVEQMLILHGGDGRTLEVEARIARMAASAPCVLVSILTVLAWSEDQAVACALDFRDPLTALPQERVFQGRLDRELAYAAEVGRPLGLILLDVDHLRRVNDRLGREMGDAVLKKLAGVLRASVREGEVVARLCDDDFAILLPGAGRGEARQVAARVRATVERTRFVSPLGDDEAPVVTLSLGAASFPADADSAKALYERAFEALREARAHGRNRLWMYTRRPRVMVTTPVYLDGDEPLLVGFSQDLSPSGIFVQTPDPLGQGMRCALAFPLPGYDGHVHVIGRVVRAVPPPPDESQFPSAGMGIEFEKFRPEDRVAIEEFLHANGAFVTGPESALPA